MLAVDASKWGNGLVQCKESKERGNYGRTTIVVHRNLVTITPSPKMKQIAYIS
jgi:hypothetical protein